MQNRICPECGEAIEDKAEVCSECGFNFSNEKSENKEESAEAKKSANLLLEVPYRYNFNKGWKDVFDWLLSFGWLIGVALIVAGIIVYIVAGTKSANAPLEILDKAVNIKYAHDTVNILVTLGLVVVLVQMLGDAIKNVYLRIFYSKWISKRKEQALETILKFDVATASAEENSLFDSFVAATYHAHNPKENRFTAVAFIVYAAVCLFAMISTILLARECVDIYGVKMINELIGEKFDIFSNLPLKLLIVFVLAWVAYFLIKKLCTKSYENRYNKWAKQVGIFRD